MSGTPLDSPALFRFRSVRLFKDVPNLNFSFRIKATAIWKFRLKITNCDFKFRRKKENFKMSWNISRIICWGVTARSASTSPIISEVRYVLHQRSEDFKNITMLGKLFPAQILASDLQSTTSLIFYRNASPIDTTKWYLSIWINLQIMCKWCNNFYVNYPTIT